MAEKKENTKKFDLKNFNDYFDVLKKYSLKLLSLDANTYFLIVPGILLLVGLLIKAPLYYIILRIYLCVSAVVLAYKFYTEEKDNIFAAIFAGIAIIYNPIPFLAQPIDDIKTGPIIIGLTLAIFVLGHQKIK
tara:strand:+ start:24026 stop:24424 length:399 start_codon:yes stop_codon:yes gene_type:complete